MLNALIDGIVAAIQKTFGDDYPIYTDGVEQGLNEPCFSIRIVKPTITQFLGNRYFRTNLVAVHYFPKSYGDNTEMNIVIEKLFSTLEYIHVSGGLTRGTKPDLHVEDGVGIFTINYDFFVYKIENEDGENKEMMETLTVKGGSV